MSDLRAYALQIIEDQTLAPDYIEVRESPTGAVQVSIYCTRLADEEEPPEHLERISLRVPQ